MECALEAAVSPIAALLSAAGPKKWSYLRDVVDLRFLWRQYESEVGHHSLHGAMVDRLCGLRGNGGAPGVPPFVRYACWTNRVSRRIAAVRTALRRMSESGAEQLVTVLFRMHGPEDRKARRDLFGEIAPLAEYVPAVEERRTRIVETLIAERERNFRAASNRLGVSAFRIARGVESIRNGTEREVTTAYALSDLLDLRIARRFNESRAQFDARHEQARAERHHAEARIRREAEALFGEATRAYRAAMEAA